MRNMMLFYLKFPILSALRRKLTWTHFFYSNEFKKNQPAVDQISSLALLQSEKSIALLRKEISYYLPVLKTTEITENTEKNGNDLCSLSALWLITYAKYSNFQENVTIIQLSKGEGL
jgi:hypothetical protein